MKRRLIGVVAALVLASVGTFALVTYVQSAKDAALAGEPRVDVYVLERDIAANTPASTIEEALTLLEIPESVLVDDAVTDLEALDDDLIAAVDLRAGEQLLRSRLVAPETLTRANVPEGLQELTLALDPERAVGGNIAAGDTVGVVLSFDPFDVDGSALDADDPLPGSEPPADPPEDDGDADADDDGPEQTPNMTHLTFHKVLVTSIQYDRRETTGPSEDDEIVEPVERAPSQQLLVTLALSSPEVEQVVFAAEFGHIWLTAENADASEDGARIVTLGDIYDATETDR